MSFSALCEKPTAMYRAVVQQCKSIGQEGSGWLILCAVMFLTVIRSGTTYSFGEIITDLIHTFPNHTMAELNWIGTLSFTVSMSFSPFSVRLIRSIKSRRNYAIVTIVGVGLLSFGLLLSSVVSKLEWLFLTHSCLYGMGSSCIYMSESLIIGEYFDKTHKRHVLATSILLCGYPVASLLFNPLTSLMIERWGWRLSFRMMACLVLVVGMICQLTFVAPNRPENENQNPEFLTDVPAAQKDTIEEAASTTPQCRQYVTTRLVSISAYFKRIFGDFETSLWLFGNMLVYIAFFMPFLNLPSYIESKGIGRTKGSLSLTMLSSAELISYIIASTIGDRLKGSLIVINIIAATLLSAICFLWTFIDFSYYIINALCMALGAGLGLTIVYQFAASAEVTGMPIDTAWPLTNLWSGIGVLFGPLFSGAIYDIRHHYHDVFYVMGGIYLVQLIIFGLIYFRRRNRRAWDTIVGYSELHENHATVAKGDQLSAPPVKTVGDQNYSYNLISDQSDKHDAASLNLRLHHTNGNTAKYSVQYEDPGSSLPFGQNADSDYRNGARENLPFPSSRVPYYSTMNDQQNFSSSGQNPFRTTLHRAQPD